MTVDRLLPLPVHYQKMKEQHLLSYGEKGFKGYRSPWIPVAENNLGLVKKGDLVISSHDMKERPFRVGRGLEEIGEGRTVGRKDEIRAGSPPIFVWADSRGQKAKKLLDGNPFADNYAAYSEAMKAMLRTAHSLGIQIVEEVKFPIYHETNINYATNILVNGIDYSRVCGRNISGSSGSIRGTVFCAGRSIQETLGKGNFHGAMVEFYASFASPPLWIDFNNKRIQHLAVYPFAFLSGLPDESPYAWYVICAELSASALALGSIVIFDHFEKYRVSRVLVEGFNY